MLRRRASLRIAAEPVPLEDSDRGLTVHEAARAIGVDPSTIRKMLKKGELRGHRAGLGQRRRGVRVSAESVTDYKVRNVIVPDGSPVPAARAPISHSAYREAVAQARKIGLL